MNFQKQIRLILYCVFDLNFLQKIFIHWSCVFVNDELRFLFCKKRFLLSSISFLQESKYSLKKSVSHNLTAFEHFQVDFQMQRSKRLIFSLLADETVNYESKILVIGPRSENEIIFLKSLGFKNIEAIDLISYTDFIKLGDMHKLPYQNNHFDIIVCGWTLSYSNYPQKVIKEFVRKIKTNGLIGIGIEHESRWELFQKKRQNRDPRLISCSKTTNKRINSASDILRLFPKKVKKIVIHKYDAELKKLSSLSCYQKTGLHSSQVMVTVKIHK